MEKFREIELYETETGRSPVLDFIKLTARRDEQAKIMSVLQTAEIMQFVPGNFLKKLQGRDKLWEIKVQRFRFLGFYINGRKLILLHGFVKQSQKTPQSEIAIAVQRQSMYLSLR